MDDRRAYDRIKLVIHATISRNNIDDNIVCDIIDISEEGMRIRLSADSFIRLKIRRNDVLTFQFLDRYRADKQANDVITDEAKVVYIQNGFGFYELGCYIKSDTYTDYVTRRRTMKDVEALND